MDMCAFHHFRFDLSVSPKITECFIFVFCQFCMVLILQFFFAFCSSQVAQPSELPPSPHVWE